MYRKVEQESKYMKCEDFLKFENGNLIPNPVSAQECLDVLTEFFLGEDYYIALSCNQGQANAIITEEILSKFPRKYKKFCKKKGWKWNGK